jgi:RNA polymerase sigma-70 factor (ECF subfamily)
MSDDSDESLMIRFREGDTAAFDVLYARHRAAVYRFVRRQAGADGDADGLFQDVWERVVRHRRQWRPGRPFRPWLYGIAHNRLRDHWRARRDDVDPIDDHVVVIDRGWPDAVTLLHDCAARLRAMLDHLPEVQRTAFLLKEEGDLTLEQIAVVTGVGRETVKSRLRYALRRLRQGLEGCDG